MFRHYVFSALRSLKRQRLFAAINILGLAIGLAACTLIILFVRHEFSYDNFFADIDRLYRIEATANIPGQQTNAVPNFFGPAYDLLPDAFPEIDKITRLQNRDGTVVRGETSTPELFGYADPEFVAMFNFPVVEGRVQGALDEPGNIVLTREMAIKHLGEAPWVGRTLQINETFERDQKVVAVIETLPGNTHFNIDFLMAINPRLYESQAVGGGTDLTRWNGLPFFTYIKLHEGESVQGIRAGINDWVDRYFPSDIKALVGIEGSELFTPRLVNVKDIHMLSPVVFDMKPSGSMATIYGFAGIAGLIMLIACINFMNLATAASTLRAKEVAVRKVMGASRGQLFVQFELEAICSAVLALFLALVAIELILPVFSDYTQRDLTTALLLDPLVFSTISALTILVGLFAGMHPALVLSGFRPAKVLQSNKSSVSGNPYLRTTLVLFQFAISAALIISTLLIYIQTDHARTQDLGYDNDHVMTLRGIGQDQVIDSAETIADEVARLPGVKAATLASFSPGDGRNVGLSLRVPGQDDRIIIFYRSVYPSFFEQFNVRPIAGRLLGDDYAGDRTTFISDPNDLTPQNLNVVVNEAAVKTLGFGTPQEAIGKVYYRGRDNQIVSTIVGVIPDINFGSPRTDLDGEIYIYIPSEISDLIVTFEPGQYRPVSTALEQTVRDMFPRVQTEVQHLQDNISEQYQEEAIQSTLLALFSGLAILVACMGLFGLASFTISRRTKEIGVRKVMGASSLQIIVMLLSQFSRPVLIANVIAWPFCWYAVNQWMQGFNHQIELLPWFIGVGALAAMLTLLLAWGTVASHAMRVARTSPVYALRYE